MQNLNHALLALIGVVVLAIAGAAGGFRSFEFEDDLPQKVLSHTLALLFFALLIERAVEIIVNDRFFRREVKVNARVVQLKRKGDILQAALDHELQQPLPAMTDPQAIAAANATKTETLDELRGFVRETKKAKIEADQDALPDRARLAVDKKRYAAMTATILGGLFAISGVTILSAFVKVPAAETAGMFFGLANQVQVFTAVDIVLTAVILAGGAEGMHQIIKRFVDYRDGTSAGT